MYGGIHRAINEAAALREDGAYMYELVRYWYRFSSQRYAQ